MTPDEVFDFVLDPAQYTKADTKMVWVTKLADTPDGMLAREDGKFLGRFPGSVITRYRWERPNSIDVLWSMGFREFSTPGSRSMPWKGGHAFAMSRSLTWATARSDGSTTWWLGSGSPARWTRRLPRSAGFSKRANAAEGWQERMSEANSQI